MYLTGGKGGDDQAGENQVNTYQLHGCGDHEGKDDIETLLTDLIMPFEPDG